MTTKNLVLLSIDWHFLVFSKREIHSPNLSPSTIELLKKKKKIDDQGC